MTHMRLRVGQMKQQNSAGLTLPTPSYTLGTIFSELQQVKIVLGEADTKFPNYCPSMVKYCPKKLGKCVQVAKI